MSSRCQDILKTMKHFIVIAIVTHACFADPTIYDVGVGIADITGPAAEINTVRFNLTLSMSKRHKISSCVQNVSER